MYMERMKLNMFGEERSAQAPLAGLSIPEEPMMKALSSLY